jgi:hypothetical protein
VGRTASKSVLLRQENKEVQVGQEGVDTNLIKCHKNPAWDMPQVLPRVCLLQEAFGWEHPWDSLFVVSSETTAS